MVTKKMVENKLREVIDPELGINIVDLGLIYKVEVVKGSVYVLMTLTFPGCPLGAIINKEITEKINTLEGVKKIRLEVTFNPPWDLTRITQEARLELGM